MAESHAPALAADIRIRLMGAPDLAAYKALRDLMLAAHPEAFTSDAETELRRPPESTWRASPARPTKAGHSRSPPGAVRGCVAPSPASATNASRSATSQRSSA